MAKFLIPAADLMFQNVAYINGAIAEPSVTISNPPKIMAIRKNGISTYFFRTLMNW
jgi:hypothetical protein